MQILEILLISSKLSNFFQNFSKYLKSKKLKIFTKIYFQFVEEILIKKKHEKLLLISRKSKKLCDFFKQTFSKKLNKIQMILCIEKKNHKLFLKIIIISLKKSLSIKCFI